MGAQVGSLVPPPALAADGQSVAAEMAHYVLLPVLAADYFTINQFSELQWLARYPPQDRERVLAFRQSKTVFAVFENGRPQDPRVKKRNLETCTGTGSEENNGQKVARYDDTSVAHRPHAQYFASK